MNRLKIIKWLVVLAALTGLSYLTYAKFGKKKEKQLYQTEKMIRRNITQVVNATGKLEAEGTINIGSLINGIVESLHAEENQVVKKGQLLATIDDGKEDTDVKRTLGLLQQANAQLTYQKAFYAREKKLFESGLIAQDEFDQAQQSYDAATASLDAQDAAYQQALLQFNEKKITSPINGVVINKHVSLREGVSNFSPPTILYTLAEDIRHMKVELEIDEADIGLITLGLEAKLYFDAYPYKTFRGKIYEKSCAPINGSTSVIYKISIKIDNTNDLLKPGMTAHARIIIAKKQDILAIPGHLLTLDSHMLKAIAQQLSYSFKPLTSKEKNDFRAKLKDIHQSAVKSVWIYENKSFIQKPIQLGITDNAYFEIVSGLTGNETLITDIEEPDAMLKLYQHMFGGLGGQQQ